MKSLLRWEVLLLSVLLTALEFSPTVSTAFPLVLTPPPPLFEGFPGVCCGLPLAIETKLMIQEVYHILFTIFS